MKKLLILGGSYYQVPVIKYAKSAGYYVITCDYLPSNPGHQYADEYYNVSTTDVKGVLQLSEKLNIDGILAYASDPAAPTAAFVGNKLGITSNPIASVEILSNKDLYREHLSRYGFNCPKFAKISSVEEFKKNANFVFPSMVKPTDSSGSKGVSKIENEDQFPSAFDYSLSFSRSQKCIVEEYIEKTGPQIGGEAFVLNGKLISMELGDQVVDPSVNRFVPCGMTFPSSVSGKTQKKIYRQLQRLIETTGFQFGGMNLEIMLDCQDKIYLMEVSARTGGNYLPELVSFFAPINYTQSSVELAMGNSVQPNISANSKLNGCYAYYAIHSGQEGILKDIGISPELNSCVIGKHFFVNNGEVVKVFCGADRAIGILLLRFESRIAMEEKINKMGQIVRVALS